MAALTSAVPPAPTNPLDTKHREGTAGLEPEVATTAQEPDPATASVADLATAADLAGHPAGGHATLPGSPAAAGPPGRWFTALLA